MLAFLALTIGASLTLFAWRAPKVSLGGSFELLSRESLLLINNILLVVAAGAVLLGTLYPLILDALGLGKISVGPPYFEAVFVPLMAPVILLLGIGPFARWKRMQVADLVQRLKWVGLGVLLLAITAPLLFGRWSVLIALGLVLGGWAVAASLAHLVFRLKSAGNPGRIPRAYWGMVLAHMGVGIFILGVTFVKGYESANEVRMAEGDTTSVAGYNFKLLGVSEFRGPNYIAAVARVEVSRDGRILTIMAPEKRFYVVQRMPMTEAAIDTGVFRDLYVSMGEQLDQQTWIVRVQHKPLIAWIWGGCLLMALGGLVAASDRRYRLGEREEPTTVPVAA